MMNLIAVFVENKPGQTANITRTLAEAGVNICWVTVASSGTFGVMKFLVDKRDQAVQALKAKNLTISLLNVLAVETDNRPGALGKVADLLAQNEVNLDNCSGFVANHRAVLLLELEDVARARKVLEEAGLRVLTREEMLAL